MYVLFRACKIVAIYFRGFVVLLKNFDLCKFKTVKQFGILAFSVQDAQSWIWKFLNTVKGKVWWVLTTIFFFFFLLNVPRLICNFYFDFLWIFRYKFFINNINNVKIEGNPIFFNCSQGFTQNFGISQPS